MQIRGPSVDSTPGVSDRSRIERELLRLGGRVRVSSIVWQLSIALLTAGFFGHPNHRFLAGLWLALVLTSLFLRVAFPITDPGASPTAVTGRLKQHQMRVLFSAFAWGSAGYLLFDRGDLTRQLALTVVLVSTTIGFSLSASVHAPTLRRSMPFLLLPVCASLIFSSQANMWMMGLMGASFMLLMRRVVTERGEQLEEILQLRMAAQEARDQKQRFFAAASHDLRQPLQALSLYHTVLSKGDSSAAVVQRMGECIDALERLLAGVLTISRLDSGKVVVQAEPLHLPTLMLRVGSLHEPSMREKGLRLRLHVQDVWVRSDPSLLERILSNLLSNATRYTETGGVLFAARRRGQNICLQVFDTGIGIEEEAFQSIFSEFAQLNNPARDPTRGSGLGLATVQRMVHLLDHHLSLNSTPGRGSCFQLKIPLTSAPTPEADSAASAEADTPWATLTRRRVLVVDDNALVADALRAMLMIWNLDVTVAADALSAKEALQQTDFDVVISDWRLPGTEDGLAVLRFARAQHPTLLLAALLTGDNVEDLHEEFPVITKPVRALRLRALLQAHLGKS